MLNISPIGRSCTPEERIEFSELDKVWAAFRLTLPFGGFVLFTDLRSPVLPPSGEKGAQLQAVHQSKAGSKVETGLEAENPRRDINKRKNLI